MKRRAGKGKPSARSKAAAADGKAYVPRVRKTSLGVWDIVIERTSVADRVPALRTLQFKRHVPYLRRFLGDLFAVSPGLLILWLVASALNSIIPAASLYWSSKLLRLVQDAVDKRRVDEGPLIRAAFARMICTFANRGLPYVIDQICATTLNMRIRRFFDGHLLRAHVRLDLVTFSDPKVEQELAMVSPESYSSAWRAVSECVRLTSLVVQLVSQITVLVGVIHQQRDGLFFFLLTMAGPAVQWFSHGRGWRRWGSWYATSHNEDYLRMMGFQKLAYDREYREDIVSSNLQEYIEETYLELSSKLGDAAVTFREAWTLASQSAHVRLVLSISAEVCRDLPQVLFALSASRTPSDIPLSLTWLALLRESVVTVSDKLNTFMQTTGSLDEHFEAIDSLYNCAEIENQIADGDAQYPQEETRSEGMSIEMRNVSFKYPGSDKWALQEVSFAIEPGQLCVIVGRNGSGKSSTVKLLTRLYDCQRGEILIDGEPIQSLLLSDYRRCLSVLPQDFTYFPLTVAENIGIGDPDNSGDMGRIRRAAELGGALDFIENDIADGFSARLKGPTSLHMHTRDPDFESFAEKEAGKHRVPNLSGGQWQRLALSRTFMRSSDATRLLCYDEPSAALDPIAEYDLFKRLRQLRGKKTMVFVTHRFGHLTRFADKIIYLDASRVVEQGTHPELLALDGGYAKMYNLQAQAFSAT